MGKGSKQKGPFPDEEDRDWCSDGIGNPCALCVSLSPADAAAAA